MIDQTKTDYDERLHSRVIARETTVQYIRVVRFHEHYPYVVQIQLPDKDYKTRTAQWHTLFRCDTRDVMEGWLEAWLNRRAILLDDDEALLAVEAK